MAILAGCDGGLGVDPVNALEREYGDIAIKLIVTGLAVTPLRRWAGINLLRFRRAIGVTCFFFVLAHFLVWALLDIGSLGAIWADIVKRPYVTVGMLGFLLLIPLALTSNNLSLRRMGALAWRRLHKLTYAAAILGAVHYLWIAKVIAVEPLVYLSLILGLLILGCPGSTVWRRVLRGCGRIPDRRMTRVHLTSESCASTPRHGSNLSRTT